ncbi:hypothetical protein [Agrobacterium sp. ICMP 6402]|uniref:hypothetical protein n=1 Tax=Agrobacterium sp. ICMP 6402 TaxID=2292443 RepID=UPI001FEE0654
MFIGACKKRTAGGTRSFFCGSRTMHIFRIRILLPALFGITVLFSIAQGAASMRSIGEMEQQAGNIVRRMERSLIIADLSDRLSDIRRNYLVAMNAATPEARNAMFQRILKSQQERAEAFDAYGAQLQLPATIEKFQRLNGMVTNYEAMGAELKKNHRHRRCRRRPGAGRQDDAGGQRGGCADERDD